jgi:hypothetical protein
LKNKNEKNQSKRKNSIKQPELTHVNP